MYFIAGKFGEDGSRTQHMFIKSTQLSVLYTALTNPQLTDLSFDIIDENIMSLTYKKASLYEEILPNCNIFLACITTAEARLKLYSLLDQLQERLLYCDTDSVIYSTKKHEESLPLGNYLGQLTNEIPSGYMVEFVCSGPKCYAFKVVDKRHRNYTVVKCKGFSLSARTCKKINFTSMKKMVLKATRDFAIHTVNPHKIMRSRKRTSIITTGIEFKRYKLVYNKRFLLPDRVHTLPYGWK